MVDDTFDKLLDEFVTGSKKMNGQVLHEREPWNTSVTADAIRHYAYGISDDNPLWINRKYATQSGFGQLVAPPTFVASVLYPGLHGMPMKIPLSSLIGELRCSWFMPILEGDELQGSAKQLDVYVSRNRQGRCLANILAEITYKNQRGEVVARAESLMVRVEQRDTELLTDFSIYKYTDIELEAIKQALESEKRTGLNGLSSDQTEVGYELDPLVRGPLTVGDLICWQAAIGPSYRPGALGYRDCVDQPHTVSLNPVTGWPVKYSQQHEDSVLSQQRGMPAPFDNTVMRWAWLSTLVTNWMGDHGFLRRFEISAIEPILYGDTNWYRGKVTKRVVNDTGVILTLKISGTNQRGVITTTGGAEVEIPHHAIRSNPEQVHRQVAPEMPVEKVAFHPAHRIFEQQATMTPAAKALAYEGQHLTYGQLNRRSNQLAHHLVVSGARPGDRVGICVERSMDMVIGQLAVLKAGCVYVPLDHEFPGSRLRKMLDETSVSMLLTHRCVVESISATNMKTISLDTDLDQIMLQPDHNPQVTIRENDLAYIMYTSGSLGMPKAVAIAHLSLLLYMNAVRKEIPLREEDNYLYTASPCFSASIRQTMLPLCSGANLVITNSEERKDPKLLFETMRKYGVSVWDTVPSVWRRYVQVLREMPEQVRSHLLDNRIRLILVTGEALRWETPYAWVHEFGHKAAMINLYSQTETSGTVSLYRIPENPTEQDGNVPLGYPVEGAVICLLDDDLQPVASGEVGELCVAGGRIAKGYLNDAALTAGKFVRVKLEHDGQRVFYRTGDMARYGKNHMLLYSGRRDNQVKLRGYRIQLGEIESTLCQHTAIENAVVVMRVDAAGDDRLVAYTVTRDTSLPNVEHLRSFLAERLPEYMVPSVFVGLADLPLTQSGKVDRAALPSPLSSRPELASIYVPAENAIEGRLVHIWEEVLGIGRVGVHDDFFVLGGDSLSATRVITRINDAFGTELTMIQLFESPSVRTIAMHVCKHLANQIDGPNYSIE